jgi:hypothetical protein
MASALTQQLDRLTGTEGSHATDIRGLTLFRLHRPSEPTPGVIEPSLCVIAQGQKHVRLGEEVFVYDPQQFLLVAADVPIAARVTQASPTAPYLSLSIRLDQATR